MLNRKEGHPLWDQLPRQCSRPGNYHGKWETTNCYKNLGYICELTGGQNPKPTSAPGQWKKPRPLFPRCQSTVVDNCLFALDSHCDRGYLLYKDSCYHFETEAVKNWHDAEARCVGEQGHLASFHSEEELSFLLGERLRKHILLMCDFPWYFDIFPFTQLTCQGTPGWVWMISRLKISLCTPMERL